MKKIIISLCMYAIISFCCVSLLSAETTPKKVIEGYGNFPWGSSIKDVKKGYENLEEYTAAELVSGERSFKQIKKSTTRYIRFYNDKLYWAKIIYKNATAITAEAVMEKLMEIYGQFDDGGESKEDNTNIVWLSRSYSPKLKITFTGGDVVNDLGHTTESSLSVEYVNPIIRAEIDNNEKNREKDEIEL